VPTFKLKGSSHAVDVSLSDNRILTFFFDDIDLPPTSIDSVGSHGMVVFEIAPIPGLISGQIIPNEASIYFDFNAPVFTNLKEHEVVCPSEENAVGSIEPTICRGDSFAFLGIVLDEFLPEAEIVHPGVAGNGCDSIYHVNLQFYPAIMFDSIIISADDGTGAGAVHLFPVAGTVYNYHWNNGSTSNSIENLVAGNYSVTITDVNGCIAVFNYEVFLNTGSGELEKDVEISLRPNPAKDILILSSSKSLEGAELRIYGMDGRMVKTDQLSATQEYSVDIGQIPPALYFIELAMQSNIRILKFVKE
jgi:hypothetical protein